MKLEKINEKDTAVLKRLSSREVILNFPEHRYVSEYKNILNVIEGIKVDNLKYRIGTIINLNYNKEDLFKVNYIEKNTSLSNTYSLLNTKLTKASKYIFPLLKMNGDISNNKSFLWKTNFINCYIGTFEDGITDRIYLVYRFSGQLDYIEFEKKLESIPTFLDKIDLDLYHVMYIFNIKDKDYYNYSCFKKGNYSLFSEDYKERILNFHFDLQKMSKDLLFDTNLYGVLYKTPKRKIFLERLVDDKNFDDNLEYESVIDNKELYNSNIEIIKPMKKLINTEFN